jgi:citrate synthase
MIHAPTKLLALAEELGFSGKHVALMQEIHCEFSEAKNKQIILNAVGAIGPVISDMKLHYSIVKSFEVAARAVRLIGILLKKSKLDAKTAWDRNS